MRALTFFTKKRRGSSIIRGQQVAEYLGMKLNPKSDYGNDVCIYVKMRPPKGFPRYSYFDVIDGIEHISWLLNHPKIGVIACAKSGHEYLTKKLRRDDVVLIPQHHCNYERIRRKRKSVTVAGMIGRITHIRHLQEDIKRGLAGIGVEFKIETQFEGRQAVVDFYKQIDIQAVWRPIHRPLKNPLKLVNAGSFGIPTVAFPEIGYKEIEGYYLPAGTIAEMIDGIRRLKESESLYEFYSQKLMEKIENYHISKVSKLYLDLAK